MATPLTADKLLAVLRAEGVSVVEVGGWRTHNRGDRGTGWGPVNGVILHHTVTSDGASALDLVRRGTSSLPGPLYQSVADKRGRLHLVGHGRANHAGRGDPDVLRAVIREASTLPAPNEATTDGNARFYAIAGLNWGDTRDPWPGAQLDCIARAAAAICRAHGWNQFSVIGHAEWQPGKVDPRGPGMPAAVMMRDLRGRVGELLAGKPGAGAGGAGAHTVRAGETLSGIAQRYPGVSWQDIAAANRLGPPYTIYPGDRLVIPGARTYTVRTGDTLSGIAARYAGVSWQQLASANGITSPWTIHPGDVLTIPNPQ
jgi:nucleoid-associated protein YgaU